MTTTATAPVAEQTITPLTGATTTVAQLLAALNVVKEAIPTRMPVPILAAVKIDGHGDHLTLSAFDYEMSITEQVAGTGVGTVLVSGRGLLDKIKGLAKTAPLALEVKGQQLHVRGDGITYKLAIMPAEEYPTLPTFEADDDNPVVTVATLTAEQLSRIPDVVAAAGRDDTLPILTGVHFTVTEGNLRIQATDRYRLTRYLIEDPAIAEWVRPTPKGSDKLYGRKPEFNVPAKTMALVAKHFKGRDVDVVVWDRGNHDLTVMFRSGTLQLTTRQLDGEYPRVAAIFPTTINATSTAATRTVIDVVKKVAKSAERNTPVRLDLTDAGIVVSAGQGDDDQAVSDPITSVNTGESDLAISFNPQYLLDGLAACGGTEVTISVVQTTKPATLTDPQRPGFTYLLMPVRIAG